MKVSKISRTYRATNWTKSNPVVVIVDDRRGVFIDHGGMSCAYVGFLPFRFPINKHYVLRFANA